MASLSLRFFVVVDVVDSILEWMMMALCGAVWFLSLYVLWMGVLAFVELGGGCLAACWKVSATVVEMILQGGDIGRTVSHQALSLLIEPNKTEKTHHTQHSETSTRI